MHDLSQYLSDKHLTRFFNTKLSVTELLGDVCCFFAIDPHSVSLDSVSRFCLTRGSTLDGWWLYLPSQFTV